MITVRSDFLREMQARGFVHQCSDLGALDARLTSEVVTAYVGYDCTAPSLHVGNLVSIMMLHWFQVHGHRPIALMGGGTTRVGDPSGKDDTRRLRSGEEIDANKASIKATFAKFLTFGDGPRDAIMDDNADWLLDLNYVDFLRDVGRHFSVNRMLTFDSVKLRLTRDQPLSFLEFNYMVLQAYDFVELYRRHDCRLQMGGSDQWGNIVSGIDLGRRMDSAELYALTTPLITTASGAKMGKTAAGAVWLNADLCSPYKYWQFWRNTEDADVGRFLKLFTTLDLDEIARLAALEGAEVNAAKIVLATEATAMVHGRKAAEDAAETARRTFDEGGQGDALPTVEIGAGELQAGIGVLAAATLAGLTASNGEARRHVKAGALRVNDVSITDERATLGQADVGADGTIKLSIGKKRHALLKPV
ncbi:Tyrosyl-tRNA synthetase [hydrothermal vent metagenome]|uniref:tyrosine--tRNA ligase n=1 Tax=hydrothermal vent metagenome TaxID=652676 RepID=A0A3B0UFP7_9ZZZZ